MDNATPGETPEWTGSVPGLVLSRQETNLGFSGGNNLGFALAGGETGNGYTLFLNNDTEVAPDTLSALIAFMENNPEAGIAGPPVFLASDPDRVWSAGGKFIPWKMRFRQDLWTSRGSLPDRPVRADFVSGCALMIRNELFREFGGFRDDYFIYFEDAELCTKIRRSGRSVWLVPCGGLIHHVSTTSGGELTKFPIYFSERNRIVLSREILPAWLRIRFEAYITAVLLVKTVKFLLWQGPGLIPWIWRGTIDGHLGRMDNEDVLRRLGR